MGFAELSKSLQNLQDDLETAKLQLEHLELSFAELSKSLQNLQDDLETVCLEGQVAWVLVPVLGLVVSVSDSQSDDDTDHSEFEVDSTVTWEELPFGIWGEIHQEKQREPTQFGGSRETTLFDAAIEDHP